MSKRVILRRHQRALYGQQIENLVRAAAEAVHGDRDSLSDTQVHLAGRAYDRVIAEIHAGTPEPSLEVVRGDSSSFYQTVFAEHARRYGIQFTWTAFYREFIASG